MFFYILSLCLYRLQITDSLPVRGDKLKYEYPKKENMLPRNVGAHKIALDNIIIRQTWVNYVSSFVFNLNRFGVIYSLHGRVSNACTSVPAKYVIYRYVHRPSGPGRSPLSVAFTSLRRCPTRHGLCGTNSASGWSVLLPSHPRVRSGATRPVSLLGSPARLFRVCGCCRVETNCGCA